MLSYTMSLKEVEKTNLNIKRTPLEISSLVIALIALCVIALSFSHIFGIPILSRIYNIVEPGPIRFYPRFFILFDIVIPLFVLLCVLFFILRSITYVFARKRDHGCRPDLVLIMYSFILSALTLQYLESHVQPAGSIKDFLFPLSLVLLLLGVGTLVIVIVYYIDDKLQKNY